MIGLSQDPELDQLIDIDSGWVRSREIIPERRRHSDHDQTPHWDW